MSRAASHQVRSPTQAEDKDLTTVYTEICKRDQTIWDIRLRLLAALPLVSGTAVALLIRPASDASPHLLIAFGLFEALVTARMFLYERRQIEICRHLHRAGRQIEEELRIDHGLFRGFPPDDDGTDWPRSLRWLPSGARGHNLVSVPTAGVFVYGGTFIAWLFVVALGLVRASEQYF